MITDRIGLGTQSCYLLPLFFSCCRLSYHQFLIENIPEGLHSLLPVAPAPNYRFTEEQGINFKSPVHVLQLLNKLPLSEMHSDLPPFLYVSPYTKTSLVSHYCVKHSIRRAHTSRFICKIMYKLTL